MRGGLAWPDPPRRYRPFARPGRGADRRPGAAFRRAGTHGRRGRERGAASATTRHWWKACSSPPPSNCATWPRWAATSCSAPAARISATACPTATSALPGSGCSALDGEDQRNGAVRHLRPTAWPTTPAIGAPPWPRSIPRSSCVRSPGTRTVGVRRIPSAIRRRSGALRPCCGQARSSPRSPCRRRPAGRALHLCEGARQAELRLCASLLRRGAGDGGRYGDVAPTCRWAGLPASPGARRRPRRR